MKIIVLGSGLMGVTTAYELARRGANVTLIDRQKESGAETSFSNGGQLSYTHAEPWATPSVLKKLPGWLLRSDSPLVFRPRADWQMVRWGFLFLRNCTPARSHFNCINILRLGLYSKQKMAEIIAATGIDFDFYSKGILHVFTNPDEVEHAKKQYAFQESFGSKHRMLTREECLQIEPSLAYSQIDIAGGMHAFLDECGDSYSFCTQLAQHIQEKFGVKFEYSTHIKSLHTEGDRLVAVKTDKGDMQADLFVMAMGSYSALHLRHIGINVPVYPMKGYSITLPANEYCLNASIMDLTHKIALTRLGDRLRVSGTAELTGYNTKINEKRIRPIVAAAQKLFPKADWSQPIEKWACLRPATPGGAPIMGRTRYANLFVNTGHGTLGWTQAAGSAAIVADLMEGKPPEIILHGLTATEG